MDLIGLDMSLTSTGVGVLQDGEPQTFRIRFPKLKGMTRIWRIRHEVQKNIEFFTPKLVAVEGYSMGSIGKNHEKGELGGAIRLLMMDMKVPTIIVPPTVVKQFTTGNGQADKQRVRDHVNEHFGTEITNLDEADALGLAWIAKSFSDPGDDLEDYQKKALQKVPRLPLKPRIR